MEPARILLRTAVSRTTKRAEAIESGGSLLEKIGRRAFDQATLLPAVQGWLTPSIYAVLPEEAKNRVGIYCKSLWSEFLQGLRPEHEDDQDEFEYQSQVEYEVPSNLVAVVLKDITANIKTIISYIRDRTIREAFSSSISNIDLLVTLPGQRVERKCDVHSIIHEKLTETLIATEEKATHLDKVLMAMKEKETRLDLLIKSATENTDSLKRSAEIFEAQSAGEKKRPRVEIDTRPYVEAMKVALLTYDVDCEVGLSLRSLVAAVFTRVDIENIDRYLLQYGTRHQ